MTATDTSNPALALRHKIRRGGHRGHTSGLAPGHVQCNLMILPADWAADFRDFCQRNPKPCPLVDVSPAPGHPGFARLGEDLDVRTDLPAYRVFESGAEVATLPDITGVWRDDLVAFAIGCSFSFDEALLEAGLEVRNLSEGKNVPMYRTNIPCAPAGRLGGNMVVSMRPFLAADAIRAVQVCSHFPAVHGAPVHLGDPALIGIGDINAPDYGDTVTLRPGELPVFWACGVTPQEVVAASRPPFCITHAPGCMLVTDLHNTDLREKAGH